METQLESIEEKNISPAEMIREAVKGGADLDKLEKLLEIQIKWEANEARKAFAKDFATAQANILPVVKNKLNPQTRSKYADLSDVIETAQPIYTKEGFSVTFNEGDCSKEGHARVLADVLHYLGHKEQYHLDVPLDGIGIKGNANMTAIHGKASSMQYGRRYLMCMIWNIPTADNDGNTMTADLITPAQLKTLNDLITTKQLDRSLLLIYLEIESLDKLPSKEYNKAMLAISQAKKVIK